jgi:TadE-like protein/PKD domain-containing protein
VVRSDITPTRLLDRTRRHLAERSRGQSLVEFALLLPVFMLFFATTLDLGRLAAAQLSVANAAKEGAFQASTTPSDFNPSNPCPSTGDSNLVLCRVQLELKGSGISVNPSDISITCSQTGCPTGMGSRVTVSVTGRFQLLTPVLSPFFGGTNVAFTRSSTVQRETLPAPATLPPITTTTTSSTTTSTSTSTTTTSTGTATTTTSTTSTSSACTIPSAGFTYETLPKSGQSPVVMSVVDTTTSPACAITSWFWDWGDGSTSMLKDPTPHTYLVKGKYYVTLRVANAAGTNTTGAVEVWVK